MQEPLAHLIERTFSAAERGVIYRVIRSRRHVRHFEADPIPLETLRRILDAAMNRSRGFSICHAEWSSSRICALESLKRSMCCPDEPSWAGTWEDGATLVFTWTSGDRQGKVSRHPCPQQTATYSWTEGPISATGAVTPRPSSLPQRDLSSWLEWGACPSLSARGGHDES